MDREVAPALAERVAGANAAASLARPSFVAGAASAIVLGSLVFAAFRLSQREGEGLELSFALLSGVAFGIVLQRSRFCFFCMTRDFLDDRDPRGLLGLLVALLAGTLGYHAIFGAFLPEPSPGRLPPGAHVGPVSWALAGGAALFGFGMSLSKSCISAHLYRLGEGSLIAPVALVGALVGFGIGFASWNTLYLATIQAAPVFWLPSSLGGYGASLSLQLLLLGGLALLLLRKLRPAERPASDTPWGYVFRQRWPTYVGGLLLGFLGALSFLRIGALGVTAELGSIARTAAHSLGLLPERLEGLDGFAGCVTVVKTVALSKNGLLVAGLIGGSLSAALLAGDFKLELPSLRRISLGFLGGVLMGVGAVVAIGCTIGTLLSGIMAGAVSGWIFMLFCFAGIYLGVLAERRAA